jgi:AcrR family transcriptional regulator
MAREKGLKGKETKVRIKEAATYEFANHGFYNTKVSDIVKRVNLTQPAFFLYFSCKDAIFDELVSDWQDLIFNIFFQPISR